MTLTIATIFLAVSSVIHLNTQLLAVISGGLIPMAVAFLAKEKAPDWVKVLLNAGLSAAAGIVSGWVTAQGEVVWKVALENFGITWLTSIATYYGFFKPVNITSLIARLTKDFGLGPKSPAPVPPAPPAPPAPPVAPPPAPAA